MTPKQTSVEAAMMPWIPLGPGESFKPLHFAFDARALLLRLEPGTLVPLHRHLGAVHALNVSGYRKLIEENRIVGPGDYVYEPPGNVDSWVATGDEPLVVHIVSHGAMEYLDSKGEVLRRDTASSLFDVYHAYCREHGLTPRALGEASR